MRRRNWLLSIAAWVVCAGCATAQIITAHAGTGWTFPANPLPAVNAPSGSPFGIGKLYLTDGVHIATLTPQFNDGRVSRVNVTAIVPASGGSTLMAAAPRASGGPESGADTCSPTKQLPAPATL